MCKKQKLREDFKCTNVVTLASTFGEDWAEEIFREGWQTHEYWDFGEEKKISIAEIKKRINEHEWRPGDAPVLITSLSLGALQKGEAEQAPPSKKSKISKKKHPLKDKVPEGQPDGSGGDNGLDGGSGEGGGEEDQEFQVTEDELSDGTESEDEDGDAPESSETDDLQPSQLFSVDQWTRGDS
eukprot:g18102.t1